MVKTIQRSKLRKIFTKKINNKDTNKERVIKKRMRKYYVKEKVIK